MRIETRSIAIAVLLASIGIVCASPARAGDHEHGAMTYHGFTLEADYGGGKSGPVTRWDLDGWIGGDFDKLWIKSEGEYSDGTAEQAEVWGLYSRNVTTFWDVQAGLRYDARPESTAFLVAGVNGLAPQFFETQAHLFLSDDGVLSARLHVEKDILLTQSLVVQPHAEANLFARDAAEQEAGAGLADAELGLQTRYEFTRRAAPYIDISYERTFGETAAIARHNGEGDDNAVAALGFLLMF